MSAAAGVDAVRAAFDRGAFVVSIDTELAWGEAHRRPSPPVDADGERAVITAALAVLDRYGIPATWAVVGHLLLDGCGPEEGRLHPDIVRPGGWDGRDGSPDWFAVDPGGAAADHPAHYAPDVVAAIRACPTAQEVGCHAFSHMDAGDDRCPPAAFASELDRCRELAGAEGIELRSLVFPRNSIGHLDLLAARGFTSYRGARPRPFAEASTWARPWLRVIDRLRPMAGSAVWPTRRADGVWDVPQTVLLAPSEGRRRRFPVPVWAWAPRRRIDQAVRHRSLVHVWLHPSNLAADPRRGLDALEQLCRAAAGHRDAGRLDTASMAGLVSLLEARLPTTTTVGGHATGPSPGA